MDTFAKIISSILVDITKAQDCANQFSASLVPKYHDPNEYNRNENLIYFPVPNSSIKSFEFNLQFAIPTQTGGLSGDILKPLDSALAVVIGYVADRAQALSKAKPEQTGTAFTDAVIQAAKISYFGLLASKGKSKDEIRELFCHDLEKIVMEHSALFIKYNKDETEHLRQVINNVFSGIIPIPDAKCWDESFDISYEFNVLKELDESILGSIKFEVDIRNFGLGFQERENGNMPTGAKQEKRFLIEKG
ncbi:MAG: hypothetical protein JWO03_2990 [Bacteroidetes bacterium]|nr:hypothetical protein [Bacteroidota bacterium]